MRPSGAAIVPDALLWWGGAHTGYIHVGAPLRVATPLTMVSTWDGDELSLVREHHQLRAARTLDIAAASAAFDRALEPLASAGYAHRGAGLYRVIEAKAQAAELAASLAARDLTVRDFPGGRLALIPPLDRAAEAAERLGEALREIFL